MGRGRGDWRPEAREEAMLGRMRLELRDNEVRGALAIALPSHSLTQVLKVEIISTQFKQ